MVCSLFDVYYLIPKHFVFMFVSSLSLSFFFIDGFVNRFIQNELEHLTSVINELEFLFFVDDSIF